jgi:pimeloyl-ACP methyl ester carboxylesterase
MGFRDRVGSNVEHGRELTEAVVRLSDVNGGRRVAVVAHSMGGLAVHMSLRDPAVRDRVSAVAFLATPHRGTWAAYLGWGGGAREMRPGSAFLRELQATPWPEGLPTIDLWTAWETHIIPGRSTRRDGVRAVRIPATLHFTLPYSRRAFDEVVRFLEEVGA